LVLTEEEIKAKNKAYNNRPEIKIRKREYNHRPENKAKAKEREQNPENKAKKSLKRKTPEYHAKAKVYRDKPENKLKNKTRRELPENRLKHKLNQQKPEAKAKAKERNQRPEIKARDKVRKSTPEYKIKRKKYRDKPENKKRAKAYQALEKTLTNKKIARAKIRYDIFSTYSKLHSNSDIPCCRCCGENNHLDFLNLDHIQGREKMDSIKELTDLGYSSETKSEKLLSWVRKHNCLLNLETDYFQILCSNCNFAKGMPKNNNKCPHEKT